MLAVLLAASSLAFAQLPIEQTVDDLFRTRQPRETAISPDGKWVAWVQPAAGSEDTGEIWIRDLQSNKPFRISAGKTATDEHAIAWSPDNSQLAFLSDADSKGQMQLYIAPATAKAKARRVTASPLNGPVARPEWSPDGTQIAFLYAKGAGRAQGALEATAAQVGEIDSAIVYQRVAIASAKGGGDAREITPADQYVYEYAWSPDSARFVYIAAPGPGENNWWIAAIHTVEISTGASHQVVKPQWQVTVPRFSPDGKSIAYINGLMSDEGFTGGDIFVVDSEGRTAPRNLTPGRKTSPSWLRWTASGKQLLFTESDKGGLAVSTLDVATGSAERVWRGDETIASSQLGYATYDLSMTRDLSKSAVIRSSFDAPPEVWAGPIGQWKQVTNLNTGLNKAWGAARSIEWKSEQFDVQGWLLEPARYDKTKRYPMVVVIHGGPSSSVKPAWGTPFFNTSVLSEQGYFVFLPNPRGSYGQGEAFTQANIKDFGAGDLRDILSGVDAVLSQYPAVDPKRLGVAGWSYGGFMSMWTVTQTGRFKAAVAGAGIANWQSYYGENSIDQWMIPFFGATVYDDPEVYRKSSPITFIKQVKTPTLVVVGERDGECPAPQSFEFWHALKTLGVKTSLYVYPGEGHLFHNRDNVRDLMKRVLGWFNDNLK